MSPLAVARPRSVAELAPVVDAARRAGVPLTARGAGTSCAGNAVGTGVVVDIARHLRPDHRPRPGGRTAVVDPGVVQAVLTDAAHGRTGCGSAPTRRPPTAAPSAG